MASTAAPFPAADASEAELMIGGMTCASCAARVEKKLNRMEGVTATVNYATEKARVTFGEGLELGDLVATVEKTGYTARPVAQPPVPPPAPAPEGTREAPRDQRSSPRSPPRHRRRSSCRSPPRSPRGSPRRNPLRS
ncbi:cation transporter [Streptomyces globisporus]|uniref:cation transporter n=1 Tax=Streptomyces globisporus TaxID=1908 RepID=UPI0037C770DD